MKSFVRLILLVVLWPLSALPNVSLAGEIAIVIDDLGYQTSDQKLLDMDAQLTYAILPHTPFGKRYAKQAFLKQRDVILHLPMQAEHQNELLGPGALTSSMAKQDYQRTILNALEDIPYAIGINNHMGSLLTRMETPMAWTMELLEHHNLFFLDSKTTRNSKVEKLGLQFGVPTVARNVFLDHIRDPKVIDAQFKRLVRIAKNHGKAIAIGHPYPETYQILKASLPTLAQHNIRLVPLSKLLPQIPADAMLARAEHKNDSKLEKEAMPPIQLGMK